MSRPPKVATIRSTARVTSCGDVAWRAVDKIQTLLTLFRDRKWPVLYPYVSPKANFDSLAAVFEQALEHEQKVTVQINGLYELCFKEKAFAEMTELQWFLTEQVEEEKTAREIVAKFRFVKNDPAAMLDMDRELGSRSAQVTSRKM